MTFDQAVVRPADTTAVDTTAEAAVTQPSTSSFLSWCTLDVTGQALVCAACDVSWLSSTGDTCWVCEAPGRRVGDLRR